MKKVRKWSDLMCFNELNSSDGNPSLKQYQTEYLISIYQRKMKTERKIENNVNILCWISS